MFFRRSEPDREHRELYLEPRFYDLAFDVRPVKKECDFLRHCAERLSSPPGRLQAAVELGSGPGYHALEMARRKVVSHAVDLEPSMVSFLEGKAREQKLQVQVHEADMRDFSLPEPVDLAYVLFGSFCYLLTLDDMVANFRAVHRALRPGGVYVLELPHPRRYLRGEHVTRDEWTVERDGVRVTTRWDLDRGVPDPETQVTRIRSEFVVEEGKRRVRRVRSQGRQRVVFAQELKAVAELSGLFEAADWFGAMDRRVRFNYSRRSWRMVAVLRRRD